ncbi:beta-ketoacyl-ACP synthase II [Acidiferrimicrobium sp. IK]|uniref:beta-ketoacyl-[acyl-carrier-protein] synthase family protein n=1 Tax=Acidiferrimicrobium sp. IK TaxID=2871700 RepID=UPI0021CB51DB|nr:beta-ketoacyl-ACP synthase II [Acidiferrimicrobium sp. IK]MCU4183597.1 beta-ketoacyl-ACP synthase II [Acidiferrimicrobium sp. IK]
MLALQGAADGTGAVPGRRVAITGVGVVASCGIGAEAFWAGLLGPAPTTTIRRVEGLDATALYGPKEIRRVDPFTQFAAVAAEEAVTDAGGVDALRGDPDRAGVIIGTGVGGLDTLQDQTKVLLERGSRRVSPFLVPMMMGNRAAADVSMRYGLRGPCEATVTACAAGTHSVGNGARLIATGRCDVVLAGSAEAPLSEIGIAGFANMTALSTSGVSKPFDAHRDGFVIGEGGAVLVLEELERAKARGAHIYAEIAGAASTADAHHVTAPAPGGCGAVACLEQALLDACLRPDQVSHVNAHGTSTPLNDAAEAQALSKVFGTPGPAVTSIKGVTGHSLGAAGSLEAVALALTYKHRVIPPTAGLTQLDPEMSIDVVTGEARQWDPAPAMSNSFGFGGHNGSLVFVPSI